MHNGSFSFFFMEKLRIKFFHGDTLILHIKRSN